MTSNVDLYVETGFCQIWSNIHYIAKKYKTLTFSKVLWNRYKDLIITTFYAVQIAVE